MKRIIVLLTVAAMFAAVMAVSAVTAVADPNCAKVGDNNQNCTTTTSTSTTTTGPGNSENTPAAEGGNPNIKTIKSTTTNTNFHGRPQ